MPRGFLVKRNNKSSPVSYRIRTEDQEYQLVESPPLDVWSVGCPDQPSSQRNSSEPLPKAFTQTEVPAQGMGSLSEDGTSGGFFTKNTPLKYASSGLVNVSRTPTDSKLQTAFLDSCLNSSLCVESLKPVGRFLVQASCPPVDVQLQPEPHVPDPRHRKHKAAPKKPKAIRKLNFQDEVSTSPVLGLRIQVDARDCNPPGPAASRLLAEFICQLCKERYSDSFSLAQHKCSRIVRVEYRCPECNKIFSCPANLASHRRWHRPRPGGTSNSSNPGKEGQNCPGEPGRVDPESKENSKRLSSGSQSSRHPESGPGTMDSSMESSSAGEAGLPAAAPEKGERFECPYCSKRFRRQAYLKKHLAAHQTFPNCLELNRITLPCQLCDGYLPSAEMRTKQALWQAVSRGQTALPSCGDQCGTPIPKEHGDASPLPAQLFSCKHCPSTFFSSPGLTRHTNKCHPSENRQVFLLQLPIRPGC
ncbi:insulinoma-associated protein 1a [Mustelus asterias]